MTLQVTHAVCGTLMIVVAVHRGAVEGETPTRTDLVDEPGQVGQPLAAGFATAPHDGTGERVGNGQHRPIRLTLATSLHGGLASSRARG